MRGLSFGNSYSTQPGLVGKNLAEYRDVRVVTGRGIEGIVGITELPDAGWVDRWERIIVPAEQKERLLNHLLFSLRHRGRVSAVGLPVHGLVILAGPPGTGKTTLAHGLADQAARVLEDPSLLFVDIDPHAFPSQMLGESQRNIHRLMNETIPEIAARRPFTVVLIDEVESFAVRRDTASFETNPVDVHRATDAVLLGIDAVAKNLPRVLFVATTNFIDAVDEAFMSRADLVMHFSLPDVPTIAKILHHSMEELAVQWPALRPMLDEKDEFEHIAEHCEGWNGRQVRKLMLAALAQRLEVAKDPSKLTFDDLHEAAMKKGGVEWAGGAAPTAKELFPDVPKELMHDHDPEHGTHGHGSGHAHPHPHGAK